MADDKSARFARKVAKGAFAMQIGQAPKDISGGVMGTKIVQWFDEKNLFVLKGLHNANKKEFNPGLQNQIRRTMSRVFGGQLHYLSRSSHFESQGEIATKVASDFFNTGISPDIKMEIFEGNKGKEMKGMVMAFVDGYKDADQIVDPNPKKKISTIKRIINAITNTDESTASDPAKQKDIEAANEFKKDIRLEKWSEDQINDGAKARLKNQVTGVHVDPLVTKFNEDYQKLTVIDWITGNLDRKGDNWMINPKSRKLTLIDNANSFPKKAFKKNKKMIGGGDQNTFLWREFNLSHVPYTAEVKDYVLEYTVLNILNIADIEEGNELYGLKSSLSVQNLSKQEKIEKIREHLSDYPELISDIASLTTASLTEQIENQLKEEKLPEMLTHGKAQELLRMRIEVAIHIGLGSEGLETPYDVSKMLTIESIQDQIESYSSESEAE